jgi:hypothetical protein
VAIDHDYQGRSRFGQKRTAIRPALPARLLILGPTGGGKTLTTLSIASVLRGAGGETVVIDTEQQQGEHTASVTYADDYNFELIPWTGGQFDVRDLTATMNESAQVMGPDDVICIDGIQPFWTGVGGILDMVEGKFGSWSKVRPFQAAMMEAIKTHPSHVILTCRSVLEWAVEEVEDQGRRKKQNVTMTGVGPQFDKNVVYEMNVAGQMDQDHSLTIIKSRTTRLADRTYAAEQEREFAMAYKEWLAGGHPVIGVEQRAELMALFDRVEDPDAQRALKWSFASEFGKPQSILAEDFDRARAWVEERAVVDLDEAAAEANGSLFDGEPDRSDAAKEAARIAAEIAAEEAARA